MNEHYKALHLINVSHDLGVAALVSSVLSVEDGLARAIHLDLGDDHVGGGDRPLEGLAVLLVLSASLDVDHILLSVARHDLALRLVELSAHHHDLVVLAHGKRSHLRQRKRGGLEEISSTTQLKMKRSLKAKVCNR